MRQSLTKKELDKIHAEITALQSDIRVQNTYDSKGFKIEEFENNYGLGINTTFTYNKYGDLVTVKQTADGETAVMKYKYDKLGNPIN